MDNHELQVDKDPVQDCKRLSSTVSRKSHRVLIHETGLIHLNPAVSCPVTELWLWHNFEHLASVCRGLQQVAQGEVHDLGSFAQYADLEMED